MRLMLLANTLSFLTLVFLFASPSFATFGAGHAPQNGSNRQVVSPNEPTEYPFDMAPEQTAQLESTINDFYLWGVATRGLPTELTSGEI